MYTIQLTSRSQASILLEAMEAAVLKAKQNLAEETSDPLYQDEDIIDYCRDVLREVTAVHDLINAQI